MLRQAVAVELWAILATGAVGLAAGQIGAWLQSRRDAEAERARQKSETERLRLQLDDARDQHERDRSQADTLEWRERRISAYQAASLSALALLESAHRIAQGPTKAFVTVTADRSFRELLALKEALDLCALIGTSQTRMAALNLAIALDDLNAAITDFDTYVNGLPMERAEVRRLSEEARRVRQEPSASTTDPNAQELARLGLAVDVALDEVYAKNEAWHSAAREELGVPD